MAIIGTHGGVTVPVKAVATTNVNPSGLPGPIDGVASFADGDPVLLANQTVPAQNGVRIVRSGGAWDYLDVQGYGAKVSCPNGAQNQGAWEQRGAGAVIWGTTPTTWLPLPNAPINPTVNTQLRAGDQTVHCAAVGRTHTLPTNPVLGEVHTIHDATGTCGGGSNAITVAPGTNSINGVSGNDQMTTPHSSKTYRWGGTQWNKV